MSLETNQVHLEQPYRNTPFSGNKIKTLPLASSMGGEVLDVQLKDLDDEAFEELKQALWHHKMLFLRKQDLTPGDQLEFTKRFGELGTDAYTKGLPGFPDVQPVLKEAATKSKVIFGGGHHTDSAFLERPPSVSVLHGVDIPPYGGDTIWYNSVMAYESLSPAMREMLKPLKVHMGAERVIAGMRDSMEQTDNGKKMTDIELDMDVEKMVKGSFHPMVRKHPESGELSLYVDGVYAVGIEGMDRRESKPLLEFLHGHATQEFFACRLRWEADTVAIWDNRICLHRAFNDYDGFRRELHRTTVMGERPMSITD